jgi:hypothetical protein
MKILALPVLVIFSLLVSGLAYAHWEKIVTISGTVSTGTLDLVAISVSHNDMGLDPSGPNSWYDKDVAKTKMKIDPENNERVIITIENAYPCYDVWWHVTIQNIGTIPARLKEIRVDAPKCITVRAWDHIGEQLDPGDYSDYSGHVHVEECAEQGATYTITIEFVFWNWNEVPAPS